MRRLDDPRWKRPMLPQHSYPVLRVTSSGDYLSVLEQISAATFWRPAKNHSDIQAVVADYIGEAFNVEQLGVVAYDLEYSQSDSSNVISFATMAHRWFREQKEVHVVSGDDIANAFKLFLPLIRIARRPPFRGLCRQ
jgi:hypothetical protein